MLSINVYTIFFLLRIRKKTVGFENRKWILEIIYKYYVCIVKSCIQLWERKVHRAHTPWVYNACESSNCFHDLGGKVPTACRQLWIVGIYLEDFNIFTAIGRLSTIQ